MRKDYNLIGKWSNLVSHSELNLHQPRIPGRLQMMFWLLKIVTELQMTETQHFIMTVRRPPTSLDNLLMCAIAQMIISEFTTQRASVVVDVIYSMESSLIWKIQSLSNYLYTESKSNGVLVWIGPRLKRALWCISLDFKYCSGTPIDKTLSSPLLHARHSLASF